MGVQARLPAHPTPRLPARRPARATGPVLRLLATLTEANNDHLGVGPHEVNWGHVGSAEFMRQRLADAVAQLLRA